MNATAASPRRTTAVLAIILISYFMILLDNSIVFTALPTLDRAMQLSPTGLAWVQEVFVFGLAVCRARVAAGRGGAGARGACLGAGGDRHQRLTPTDVILRQHRRKTIMRAALIYGAGDVRVEKVPDPKLDRPTYRRKFGRYSGPTARITAAVARATTLRLDRA